MGGNQNMPSTYRTIKFINDKQGIEEKDACTAKMAAEGWRIVSESIDPGHETDRGFAEDFCRLIVCFPMLFMSDKPRTKGKILVTFGRGRVAQILIFKVCGQRS
jgi:hypothetical protein